MHVRSVSLLAAVVALVVASACASRLRGEVSYDEGADFSRYRSFALAPREHGDPRLHELAEREVQRALEAKGLRVADAASADLWAHIHMARRKKTKLSGSITGEGEFVGMEVTLEDRASGDRVWSSWAAETYREQLRAEEEIPKAVALIFEDYPPR
jgi:hypothetical protein